MCILEREGIAPNLVSSALQHARTIGQHLAMGLPKLVPDSRHAENSCLAETHRTVPVRAESHPLLRSDYIHNLRHRPVHLSSTLSISKDAVLVSLIFAVLSKPLILHHNRLNPACPIGRDICTSERRDLFVYPSTTLMFENSNARRRRWSEGAEHVRERRFMFSMLCPKWIKSS